MNIKPPPVNVPLDDWVWKQWFIDLQLQLLNAGSVGGGASTSEAYVTIGNTAGLSAERALTAGSGITITDGGANSTVTIAATGSGAPTNAAYVTIGNDATLTNERALTAGSGITITDNGANNTVVLAATASTPIDTVAYSLFGGL